MRLLIPPQGRPLAALAALRSCGLPPSTAKLSRESDAAVLVRGDGFRVSGSLSIAEYLLSTFVRQSQWVLAAKITQAHALPPIVPSSTEEHSPCMFPLSRAADLPRAHPQTRPTAIHGTVRSTAQHQRPSAALSTESATLPLLRNSPAIAGLGDMSAHKSQQALFAQALLGRTWEEVFAIRQFMEFSAREIPRAEGALLTAEISRTARHLDDHLILRSFLVGDSPTLADVAVWESFHMCLPLRPLLRSSGSAGLSRTFGNLSRWALAMENFPVCAWALLHLEKLAENAETSPEAVPQVPETVAASASTASACGVASQQTQAPANAPASASPFGASTFQIEATNELARVQYVERTLKREARTFNFNSSNFNSSNTDSRERHVEFGSSGLSVTLLSLPAAASLPSPTCVEFWEFPRTMQLHLISTFDQCERLLSDVLVEGPAFVGFDMEHVPKMIKEYEESADVLQICTGTDIYIIQLSKIRRERGNNVFFEEMPPTLTELLKSRKITKVGLGIAGDRRLVLGSTGVEINCFEDLLFHYKCSLGEACRQTFGRPLRKDVDVVMSRWDADELTPRQVRYAANDAAACFSLWKEFLGDDGHCKHTDHVIKENV